LHSNDSCPSPGLFKPSHGVAGVELSLFPRLLELNISLNHFFFVLTFPSPLTFFFFEVFRVFRVFVFLGLPTLVMLCPTSLKCFPLESDLPQRPLSHSLPLSFRRSTKNFLHFPTWEYPGSEKKFLRFLLFSFSYIPPPLYFSSFLTEYPGCLPIADLCLLLFGTSPLSLFPIGTSSLLSFPLREI